MSIDKRAAIMEWLLPADNASGDALEAVRHAALVAQARGSTVITTQDLLLGLLAPAVHGSRATRAVALLADLGVNVPHLLASLRMDLGDPALLPAMPDAIVMADAHVRLAVADAIRMEGPVTTDALLHGLLTVVGTSVARRLGVTADDVLPLVDSPDLPEEDDAVTWVTTGEGADAVAGAESEVVSTTTVPAADHAGARDITVPPRTAGAASAIIAVLAAEPRAAAVQQQLSGMRPDDITHLAHALHRLAPSTTPAMLAARNAAEAELLRVAEERWIYARPAVVDQATGKRVERVLASAQSSTDQPLRAIVVQSPLDAVAVQAPRSPDSGIPGDAASAAANREWLEMTGGLAEPVVFLGLGALARPDDELAAAIVGAVPLSRDVEGTDAALGRRVAEVAPELVALDARLAASQQGRTITVSSLLAPLSGAAVAVVEAYVAAAGSGDPSPPLRASLHHADAVLAHALLAAGLHDERGYVSARAAARNRFIGTALLIANAAEVDGITLDGARDRRPSGAPVAHLLDMANETRDRVTRTRWAPIVVTARERPGARAFALGGGSDAGTVSGTGRAVAIEL